MSETKEQLKIQALLEKITFLENQIADMRVDITIKEREHMQIVESLKAKLEQLDEGQED